MPWPLTCRRGCTTLISTKSALSQFARTWACSGPGEQNTRMSLRSRESAAKLLHFVPATSAPDAPPLLSLPTTLEVDSSISKRGFVRVKHSSRPSHRIIHSVEDDNRPEARRTSVRTLEASVSSQGQVHDKMPQRGLEGYFIRLLSRSRLPRSAERLSAWLWSILLLSARARHRAASLAWATTIVDGSSPAIDSSALRN